MPEESIVDIASKCNVLLLDIEGTTTSISFVKDKLFPYAAQHVRGFLQAGWERDDVRQAVAALRALAVSDADNNKDGVVALPAEEATKEEQIDGLVSSVAWLMSEDRKEGALKQLQGLIWKQGYDKGDLQGHVYSDVSEALSSWCSRDSRRVYIYSSGSEQAQRLLFGRSEAGDLLPHIAGHFDTSVGHKQQADSYKNIAEKIGCPPEEILFLTDILKEAEAAREAGLQVALVTREGNAPLPTEVSFVVISSLAELTPVEAGVKRKLDEQDEQPAKISKPSEEEAKITTDTETDTPADKMDSDSPTIEKKEVTIEEVVDSNDADSNPAEPIAVIEPEVCDKQVEDEKKTTPEETLPDIVITEVADEKMETVDIEPLIEEPLDLLDAECGQLLEKVRDVTDLAQPLLAPVLEEPETEEEKKEEVPKDTHVNGDNKELNGSSNGDKAEEQNGDGSKAKEQNGNGDKSEELNGDKSKERNGNESAEADAVPEIKVKSVPAEVSSDVQQAADV